MGEHTQTYHQLITFMKELGRLKDTTRTAWTKEGRQESVAEHSWRLAMLAFVLEDHFPDLDFHKVMQMCLIHDLGEAYEGDISATIKVNLEGQLEKEEADVRKLSESLPDRTRNKLLDLWWEYNKVETKEAKLVKAIDKIETIITHNQGANPADFDYGFNLEYGRSYAQFDPIIRAIREIVDGETQEKVKKPD
ncbi:HD domain-containing protein [Brevibacillus dissolubilis]|uniref:HD domain-containing protein n=1 Tax=Brevibacillus dissolubilis TaxID=1844116 RepID=UPI00111719E2|nr:HD domain-containing protein [Brevibacillus dissolubilis]